MPASLRGSARCCQRSAQCCTVMCARKSPRMRAGHVAAHCALLRRKVATVQQSKRERTSVDLEKFVKLCRSFLNPRRRGASLPMGGKGSRFALARFRRVSRQLGLAFASEVRRDAESIRWSSACVRYRTGPEAACLSSGAARRHLSVLNTFPIRFAVVAWCRDRWTRIQQLQLRISRVYCSAVFQYLVRVPNLHGRAWHGHLTARHPPNTLLGSTLCWCLRKG
jgi:hypothetical protein